jgi:hypothetical protein
MTQEANQPDADTIAKLKEAIACYGQAIEAVIEADRRVDECRKIVREKGAIREEQREKVESILKENNLSWKYIYDETSGKTFILKADGLYHRDCIAIPREETPAVDTTNRDETDYPDTEDYVDTTKRAEAEVEKEEPAIANMSSTDKALLDRVVELTRRVDAVEMNWRRASEILNREGHIKPCVEDRE